MCTKFVYKNKNYENIKLHFISMTGTKPMTSKKNEKRAEQILYYISNTMIITSKCMDLGMQSCSSLFKSRL